MQKKKKNVFLDQDGGKSYFGTNVGTLKSFVDKYISLDPTILFFRPLQNTQNFLLWPQSNRIGKTVDTARKF